MIFLYRPKISIYSNRISIIQIFRGMKDIDQRIDQYIDQWQDYCLPDRTEKCKSGTTQFVHEIDSLLAECGDSKKDKAKLFYLKGRILDLLPAYEKSAEEYLNKAIKFNPANGDCWNVLAHVLFKKGDSEGASKAIDMAIQTKGKNKISLRYQSVLLRTQANTQEESRKNIEKSVQIIKQALQMDFKDWASWYFLGNAYFSNFVANFKKVDELENALKAYNEAEKYVKHKYPDLYFNRANVEMHLEEYEKALKDLKQVEGLDSTMGASKLIETVRSRMEYTKNSFQRMAEMKSSKVEQIVKTIPNKDTQEKYEIVGVSKMKQRENPGKMLSAKVMLKLTRQEDIPVSFLAIDSSGDFLCVSLYNIRTETVDKITKDALLTVREPFVKSAVLEDLNYQIVQVFDISKMYVNKSRMSHEDFNPNVVYNETFQK